MMLDEEALANEQGRMLPSDAPPPGPVPQEGMDPEIAAERAAQEPPAAPAAPRAATPREEKMFNTLLKQSLTFLTGKESVEFMAAAAEASGPEKAIAEGVMTVVDNAVEAAAAGGIRIPESVKGAATQVAVQTLALLMVKSGLADDPQALADGAMALMQPQEEATDVAPG